MRAPRGWLEAPIGDDDRRRAFAASALALLVAAVTLTLVADPPSRPPAATSEPGVTTEPADGAVPVTVRVPAVRVPAGVASVARRFVGGYLAALRGDLSMRAIPGASAGLRRRLAARPVRVSSGMRRQRARLVGIDGHRFGGGWLVEADVASSAGVRFAVGVVVAERGRGGGPVVTRLVGD